MHLDLAVPIRLREGDKRSGITKPHQAAEFILRTAVAARFPEKMPRDAQRLWAGIQDALIDMLETDGATGIEVSPEHIRFLYEHVDKWEPPGALAHWYLPVLDLLKREWDLMEAAKAVKRSEEPR